MQQIKVKAMLLISDGNKLLVSKGWDEERNQSFYRLLGGHVEFAETAEAAVRREIMEEIGTEIEDLRFIAVVENIFTYRGARGHEIDYLFSGKLTRGELYEQDQIPVYEDGVALLAEWVSAEDLTKDRTPLYPPYDYKELLKKS